MPSLQPSNAQRKRLLYSTIIGSIIFVFFSALFLLNNFYLWQLRLTDALFLEEQAHPDIVIIGIDDKSLLDIGRWPWNRDIHAELLTLLGTRPAVIGYDISFSEPSNASDDAKLAEAFLNSSAVVIPLEARSIDIKDDTVVTDNIIASIPLFRDVTREGLVNTIADEDSITRTVPIVVSNENDPQQEHFSTAVVKEYYRSKNLPGLKPETILSSQGLMKINYVGAPRTYPTYSFSDVLDGIVPLEMFDGKIVLVGATAPNLRDTQITPVSFGIPMNGVEIHANSIDTIINENFLQDENKWTTILTLGILSLGMSLLLSAIGIIPGLVVLFVVCISYIMYAFVSFDLGVIRNLLYPVLVLVSVFMGQALYKYFIEFNQRRFLKKAFSYYVPPSVLEKIISQPENLALGGERRFMTVLFLDIQGFTSISERKDPEELAKLLNFYLTELTKRVFNNNGVVDKYMGDAIVAFWNAPIEDTDHAYNASKAAFEMSQATKLLYEEIQEQGLEAISVRVGVNTGDMIVGNMGSEMLFDYTVLGDNVNLASRLEGINKVYNSRVLITQTTYDQVKERLIARRIDTVVVKGKAKGIPIYEIITLDTSDKDALQKKEHYETALKNYSEGNFAIARKQFSIILKVHPNDGPARTLYDRCRKLAMKPPTDWDGLYHATEK